MQQADEALKKKLSGLFEASRRRRELAAAARDEIAAAERALVSRTDEALATGWGGHVVACGAPSRIAALAPAATNARRAVVEWLPTRSTFLGLSGGPGCGKTVAACWVFQRAKRRVAMLAHPLAEAEVEFEEWDPSLGMFLSAAKLRWAPRFGEGSSPLDRAATVRWLVLDELRAEDFAGVGRERLEEVLGERYAMGRRTVITTNLTGEQMVGLVGERLGSRFAEELTWEDCGDTDLRRVK